MNFGQQRLGGNATIGGGEDACSISNTPLNLRFTQLPGTTAAVLFPNGAITGADIVKEGGTDNHGSSAAVTGNDALIRKPRKKWDDVAVSSIEDRPPAYASSLISSSFDVPSTTETYVLPSSTQPSSSKENILGGFMTMNGNQIQYSSRSPERIIHKKIPNSISAPGIAELHQHVPSFSLNSTIRNPGESPESLVKDSSSMFPQSPNSAFSRASMKRCSLTKRLKGNKGNESQTVWTPPLIGNRRSTSNMHYTTVSGRTIPVTRRS
ncbi:unnamed protein product [Onchocerca flexuosa]|uniref:DUF4005 domain-containing protein n=1 Tax=Onchocerca flexuosa TaxID=387005 RepID=A0A183HI45_9BILA|nr:unnamed protein product [Onchocerca flexuosa]